MAPDLYGLLDDAAPAPTRPLDAAGLVRRARRQRRAAQALTGATAVLVLVAALVALPRLGEDQVVFEPPAAETPVEPTLRITADARPHEAHGGRLAVEADDPGEVTRGEQVEHSLTVTVLGEHPRPVEGLLRLDRDVASDDGQGLLRVVGECLDRCPAEDFAAEPTALLAAELRLETAHLMPGTYRLEFPLSGTPDTANPGAGGPEPPIIVTYEVTDASAETPASNEGSAAARFAPDLVRADPRSASPGDVVALYFPQEDTARGLGFTLERLVGNRWAPAFDLHSDGGMFGHEPQWWPHGQGGWEQIELSGAGPDRVVVPEDAEEGAYRICTAARGSSLGSFCAPLVIAAGEEESDPQVRAKPAKEVSWPVPAHPATSSR